MMKCQSKNLEEDAINSRQLIRKANGPVLIIFALCVNFLNLCDYEQFLELHLRMRMDRKNRVSGWG